MRVRHGIAEGQRTQESRVRTRNELGGVGWVKEEEREKKKTVSVERTVEMNSRNGTRYGQEGSLTAP